MQLLPNHTEAEWKFEICHALRLAELPFRLEFRTPAGPQDIAIAVEGWLFGVIETKRRPARDTGRQIIRYKSLRVPLLLCWPEHDVGEIVELVRGWIAARSGRSLAAIASDTGIIRRTTTRRTRARRGRFYLDEDINLRE